MFCKAGVLKKMTTWLFWLNTVYWMPSNWCSFSIIFRSHARPFFLEPRLAWLWHHFHLVLDEIRTHDLSIVSYRFSNEWKLCFFVTKFSMAENQKQIENISILFHLTTICHLSNIFFSKLNSIQRNWNVAKPISEKIENGFRWTRWNIGLKFGHNWTFVVPNSFLPKFGKILKNHLGPN